MSDPHKRNVNLLELHIPILMRSLNENPKDSWTLYYLAQTLAHLADYVDVDVATTFRMEALSYYWRQMALPDNDPEIVRHAACASAEISARLRLYSPQEMLVRLDSLCEQYPDHPPAHLLRLHTLAMVLPRARMPEMITAALAVADIARKAAASGKRSRFPTFNYTAPAYLVAVQSAAYLVQQDPLLRDGTGRPYTEQLEEFVRLGIEAGGDEMAFQSLRGGHLNIPIERGSPPAAESVSAT